MAENRALLVGASGLIGNQLLQLLLASEHIAEVKVLLREEKDWKHPKLRCLYPDFSAPETWGEEIAADELYLCLGSTIHRAGSVKAFRAVDVDLTLAIARRCQLFSHTAVVVSSIGASPLALNYYRKAKGDMESGFMRLDIPRKVIVRPSLLLGERDQKRWAEKLGKWLLGFLRPVLLGKWQKYRSIEAQSVAKAMAILGKKREAGVYIYESHDLAELAQQPY